MKQLPNILSVSRILFSSALFFIADRPALFLSLYLICGVTDIADGYLARRLNACSKTGALLDSAGDVAMWSAILYVIVLKTKIFCDTTFIAVFSCTIILKIFNFVFTKIKFGNFNIIHTVAYKVLGLLGYLITPAVYMSGNIGLNIAIVFCTLSLLATVEETVIIARSEGYDPNIRSIFRT